MRRKNKVVLRVDEKPVKNKERIEKGTSPEIRNILQPPDEKFIT